jgi:hypothetical protein
MLPTTCLDLVFALSLPLVLSHASVGYDLSSSNGAG